MVLQFLLGMKCCTYCLEYLIENRCALQHSHLRLGQVEEMESELPS